MSDRKRKKLLEKLNRPEYFGHQLSKMETADAETRHELAEEEKQRLLKRIQKREAARAAARAERHQVKLAQRFFFGGEVIDEQPQKRRKRKSRQGKPKSSS